MGWGRTLFLGDIGNRLDIADTERDIARLRQDLAGSSRANLSQDEQIRTLIAENAQLKLYLAALVRLLVRNNTIARSELETVIAAVDAEDGSADGQFTGKVV